MELAEGDKDIEKKKEAGDDYGDYGDEGYGEEGYGQEAGNAEDNHAYRPLIKKVYKNELVESSGASSQAAYVQVLKAVVQMLKVLNYDDVAFSFKPLYLRLYNILSVACINDSQKST